jgi:hypothetical protein
MSDIEDSMFAAEFAAETAEKPAPAAVAPPTREEMIGRLMESERETYKGMGEYTRDSALQRRSQQLSGMSVQELGSEIDKLEKFEARWAAVGEAMENGATVAREGQDRVRGRGFLMQQAAPRGGSIGPADPAAPKTALEHATQPFESKPVPAVPVSPRVPAPKM